MTTKPLNPQPGDIVHVRIIVEAFDEVTGKVCGNCRTTTPGGGYRELGLAFWVDQILAIEPRPLKVGDRVNWARAFTHDRGAGAILAIDSKNTVAWIVNDDGGYLTLHLSSLTKEP